MADTEVGYWRKTRRMKNGKPVMKLVPRNTTLELARIEREWGVRSRLRVLVGLRRTQEYRRWFSQALRAATFPGILIPFRPNARAWWNQPEVTR